MSKTVKKILSFSLLFLISIIFASVEINAQTPTPTPSREIPEIISEDNDLDVNLENPVEETSVQNTSSELDKKLKDLSARLKSVEAGKSNLYDEQQKRLLLSLDILTKTEERAENLRKKLIEMIEKETEIMNRLEGIEYNLQPENIERSTAIYGSLRPEEIRSQKKNNLETEKRNLESLLAQIQTNRVNLEESVRKADLWVEKVRAKFEAQIDKALEIPNENKDN